MNITDAIRLTAEKNNLSVQEATLIINSFYDDLHGIMKDRQGALILLKELGLFHCQLKGSITVLNKLMYDLEILIAIREQKIRSGFKKESGYLYRCHDIVSQIGSIVISQIDYYYNVYGNQLQKKRRQVNVFYLCAIIRRLDYIIGDDFHEGFCKAENWIQAKYMQRMRESGILQAFRKEFTIRKSSKMQQVWMYPEVKDSIAKFTLPPGHVVTKQS